MVDKIFPERPGGFIASYRLTIRPQPDNVLIGEITKIELEEIPPYVLLGAQHVLSQWKSASQDVSLRKPFKVYLKNGVIDSLSVDQTLTFDIINILKFIVSQFQVDTKAQNFIRKSDNDIRPDVNTNDAYYVTMEPTDMGVCKTTYDISRLPEYLAYAEYGNIPSLSKYAGDEQVIKIIKNTNLHKCNINEQTQYAADRNDQEKWHELLNSRIIITGSLDNYTIHASATKAENVNFSEYIYLTLESIEQSNEDRSYSSSPRFGNMKNVGNLDQ